MEGAHQTAPERQVIVTAHASVHSQRSLSCVLIEQPRFLQEGVNRVRRRLIDIAVGPEAVLLLKSGYYFDRNVAVDSFGAFAFQLGG